MLQSFAVSSLSAQATADSLEVSKTRAAAIAGKEGADYLLVAESPMVKVMPDRAPLRGRPGQPVEIAVAGGEIEAAQIIIAPLTQSLRGVTFRVSSLSSRDGNVLPANAVTLDVMGYVYTEPDAKLSYEVERRGWFPDPILPFVNRFDIERDKVQTLWLSVRCPPGLPPGIYEGHVVVSPEHVSADSIPVRVRVFDFTIPWERSLRTAVSTLPDFVQRVYGREWGQELYWRYADFLLANRVNMDNPYRDGEPPPSVEDIRRLVAAGQDAYALRFFRQPGKGFSDTGVDSVEYPAYLEQGIMQAKATLQVLRQAGAEKLAYVYLFDEVREDHFETLRQTALRLRAELPGVPLLTSAFDRSYGATSGLDEVIDEWIAIIAHFRTPELRAEVDRARAGGARVWWYTTIWPPRPYPNFFIEYDAIEPRILMGPMAQKFRPDGFGYWALNWWQYAQSPIVDGPYTSWSPRGPGDSHGEGSLIAAGPQGPITTIRFENFRDGLEDFEYYRLLERAVLEAERRGVPQSLIEPARKLLAVPDEIVASLTQFTRDAGMLASHRLDVAEAIERLQNWGELPEGVRVVSNVAFRVQGADTIRLDLLVPSGEHRKPAIIFIGGATGPARADQLGWHAGQLAARGFVAAIIDYRPRAVGERIPIAAAVSDAKLAIRWLRAHADEYGIDGARIGLVGAAEGALVAALAGLPQWFGVGSNDNVRFSTQLGAVALLEPLLDLADTTLAPAAHQFLNDVLRTSGGSVRGGLEVDVPLWQRISPVNYFGAGATRDVREHVPPSLFLHGTADEVFPYRHSQRLMAELRTQGVETELFAARHATHGFFTAPAWRDRAVAALGDFFQRMLGNSVSHSGWTDTTPAWSPDGEHIAFHSDAGGEWGIWVMRRDGSQLRRVASGREVAWSADGSRLVFESGAGRMAIVNVDGSGFTLVTRDTAEFVYAPAWSPDGSHIAVSSWVDNQLHIVRLADGRVQRLTDTQGGSGCSSWFPDGARMLFHTVRDGQAELYATSVDGSTVTRLTNSAMHEFCPRVSPDGRRVAFQRRVADVHEHIDIVVMNLDGSSEQNLTRHFANDRYASWSPDGKWLAFTSTRGGNSEIYVARVDGTELRRLTHR